MKKYVKNVLDNLGSKVSKLLDSMWNMGMENSSAAASLVCKRAKEVVKVCEDWNNGSEVVFLKFVEGLIKQDSLKDSLNYYHRYRELNGSEDSDYEFLGLWLYFRFAEVRKVAYDFAEYLSEKKPYLECANGIAYDLISFVYTTVAHEDFCKGDLKSVLFDNFTNSIMDSVNYVDEDEIEIEGFDTKDYSKEQHECVEILLCSDAMVTIFKGVPKYHDILIDCWGEVFKHSSIACCSMW